MKFNSLLACLLMSWTSVSLALPNDARSFVGVWEVTYSCKSDATGVYAESCKDGAFDYFQLNLQADGDRLCGLHSATAHLGNRVDEDEGNEPSISGRISGNTASVTFQSSWGGTGQATLVRQGNMIRWKVTSHDDQQSWIPMDATLLYQPTGPRVWLPKCRIKANNI
jgi:hypothetical protein